jgi:tRNA modification GTPase
MNDKQQCDTIFAVATAPGRAGVAVIRISGPRAPDVVKNMTGKAPPETRRMVVRNLYAGEHLLDEALVVVFGEGASFTGEAMAELHVHGGRATASGVIDALAHVPGCRPAAPGEFTRRALENGRLDLAQVEGLADLIDAETEAQRRQAMALMRGELSGQATKWRTSLVGALALLEASIDFADEDDAPVDIREDVYRSISGVHAELTDALAGSGSAERIRDGFVVALVGPPNAGKSSLLNALIGREAAIASPVAGTTRDIIEAVCDFDGVPVILTDMAGLRHSEDEVEKIGVERARLKASEADLRVFLDAPDVSGDVGVALSADDIRVQTKGDLLTDAGPDLDGVSVSVVTGRGLSDLRRAISDRLSERVGHASLVGRERQKAAVQDALKALDQAREEPREEICSAHLRIAITHLSGLLGEVGVEDVLDDIFSRFCMGK